jgi:hypothetical protein
MSHKQQYEAMDAVYSTDTYRSIERFEGSKRRPPTMSRGRAKAPQSFNGMHRRRRRKITW